MTINFDDLIPADAPKASQGTEVAAGNGSLNFDDLIPKDSPKPKQQYPKKRSDSEELIRQLGLTARHGMEGLAKSFTFPVNATASAIAGGLYHLGAKDAAKYVENTLGMTGGAKAASVLPDLNEMPKPENALERGVGNVSQAMAGGTVGNILSGLTSKAPAVVKDTINALLPSTTSKTALAVNAGVATGMEVAPETTLGVAGAALAAPLVRKGAVKVGRGVANLTDDALQSSANANFGKGNPNAKYDAEIIQDLAKIKKSLNPNGTKGVTLQAEDLNGLANTYLNDLRMKLKSAGIDNQDIEQALATFKQNAALPEDVLKRLGSTKEGSVALDVIEKASRLRSLIPKENAAGGVARVGRSVLDVMPIPMPLRYAGRTILGAADPRWMKAEEVVKPRNVKAAEAFLEKRGPSAATEGMGILSQMGEEASTKAAQEAAAEAARARTSNFSKTPIAQTIKKVAASTQDEIDNAYLMQQPTPPADLLTLAKKATVPVSEDEGILSTINKVAEETDNVLPPSMDGVSVLKNTFANLKQKAKDTKAAAREEQRSARLAEVNAEKAGANSIFTHHGGKADGGSLVTTLKRLESQYGIDEKTAKSLMSEMRDSLDDAGKANLDKLMANKSFRVADAFYKTQDGLVSYLEGRGYKKLPESQGILTQSYGDGILRDAMGDKIVSPNLYNGKAKALQGQYDDALKSVKEMSLSTNAKRDAINVINLLKTTGTNRGGQKRQDAINNLLKDYPEHREELMGIFKNYLE